MTSAQDHVRLVIVDDDPVDIESALAELRRAGHSVEHVVARDPDDIRKALTSFEPDIVLGDFGAADSEVAAKIAAIRGVRTDVPVVFLSGTLDEERVVVALRHGAADFVLKSRMTRLPAVVERTIREAAERSRLEVALRESQERGCHHAERIETLCRMLNDLGRPSSAQISTMLTEAAETLRPPLRFRGALSRIVGSELLILAVEPPPDAGAAKLRFPAGTRLPFAQTIGASGARTQSWDDLEGQPARPATATATGLGWRSMVTTQFIVGSDQYVLTFGSESPAQFGPEDSAYVELLASSFAKQLQLEGLETSLRESERQARLHSERLEGLWRIANSPSLHDKELWLAMLREAAATLRPGQPFEGIFARMEGGNVIVEAVEAPGDEGEADRVVDAIGRATPISETIMAQLLAAGGTYAWNDFEAGDVHTRGTRLRGWRSAIATTFVAGGVTYSLTFASRQATTEPFGPSEFAYIEIVASFFARYLHEKWQFERIAYQQSHDVLTDLPNRSRFRSLARSAAATRTCFGIVLVDINAFHDINESYGHITGDALLVEVGAALRLRMATDEILGRIGGDVFGVYIQGRISARALRDRALHFSAAFSHAFSTGDREGRDFIALTACFGIAHAPQDGATVDALLSHADAALMVAKDRGPGSVVLFEAGMEGDPRRRATLRNELVAALAGNQFELYYQPHVDLHGGKVTGCEALIRWHHPSRGLLLPADFIPFAEQSGLITGIDDWVMRAACAAADDLSSAWPDFRLFFNLSGRQAGDPALVRAFTTAARAGTRLRNVGVEITETDAMRDVEATRRVCRALHRLGVSIALDDFGVGYSSLASLNLLPVDIIKIDRSFVTSSTRDPRSVSIAETIMDISRRFGFVSLAEGVEEQRDVDWLNHTPCGIGQGYFFGLPMPLPKFKAWLDERGLRRLGGLPAIDLEELPFGAIVIDLDGTILSYNRYEANLSHLDATRLIGKNFFRDVAPCTGVQAFQGRMRTFAASTDVVSTSFNYFFPFAHGQVDVEVRFVKGTDDTILVVIERFPDAATSAVMNVARAGAIERRPPPAISAA